MRCCTKRKLREEEEAMGYWFIYSPNRWRDHGKEKLNGQGLLNTLHVLPSQKTKLSILEGDDIKIFMQVLKEFDRPVVYSLSPGVGATPTMAKDVSPLVNVYRVTGDDWDSWSDVASHFNVSSNFAAANMIGSTGLRGNSWPDLDMLPLGWLTDPDDSMVYGTDPSHVWRRYEEAR